jgi:hypothetical protein
MQQGLERSILMIAILVPLLLYALATRRFAAAAGALGFITVFTSMAVFSSRRLRRET